MSVIASSRGLGVFLRAAAEATFAGDAVAFEREAFVAATGFGGVFFADDLDALAFPLGVALVLELEDVFFRVVPFFADNGAAFLATVAFFVAGFLLEAVFGAVVFFAFEARGFALVVVINWMTIGR